MHYAPGLSGFVLLVTAITPVLPQTSQRGITLERTTCYGACPPYLLRIDASGAVSFRQGPAANRHEEHTSRITVEQFQDLVAVFTAIHFFELGALYKPTHTDGPSTYIGLTFGGNAKMVTHGNVAPPGLEELERRIERVCNVHRWLHRDPRPFTLQSPVSGPFMGGGEDLKNEMYVRQDAYDGIKPRMTPLMRAAGLADAEALRRALDQGDDVNGGDETGWTALMFAAVTGQSQTVTALLDAGAWADQRDLHGNTALIGAAAVRFGNLRAASEMVSILLAHGASVDVTNDLGESALMWAARSANAEAIRVLMMAGADVAHADLAGHDAPFYLRSAKESLTFDQALVERYNRAESALDQR
jgi:Domain of unknown function (DUF6438)/Ankyrin repeats (3 copies)